MTKPKKRAGRRTRDRLPQGLAERVRRGLVTALDLKAQSIYDLGRRFDAKALPVISDRSIRRAFSDELALSAETALGLLVRSRRLGLKFPNRYFSNDALLEVLSIARPHYDKEPAMLIFPNETSAVVNLCVSIAQEFAGRGPALRARMEKRFGEAFGHYENLNRDPEFAEFIHRVKSQLPKPWRHYFLEKRFAKYIAAASPTYTAPAPIAVLEREYFRLVEENLARRNDEEA